MTAVEWLVEQLDLNVFESDEDVADVIDKAKEMEKEQIIAACNEWFTEGCRYSTGFEQTLWYDEEEYYNKTFKY